MIHLIKILQQNQIDVTYFNVTNAQPGYHIPGNGLKYLR